jgi:hypothetical protein
VNINYSAGGSSFDVTASPAHLGLIDLLFDRTKVELRTPPYLAAGLTLVLLFLAALQAFFILGRTEPVRLGEVSQYGQRMENRHANFVATPPPHPTPAQRGRVRSFFGEIYSLMFESRR